METSLLESLMDFQFEVLTTYLNDGRRPPRRGAFRNAHTYLAAPYGVYDTKNGHLALAMTHLPTLGILAWHSRTRRSQGFGGRHSGGEMK